MTRKLFWEDPYLKRFEAVITDAGMEGIFLDSTAFYPSGGGQPGDTGRLMVDGKIIDIIDTRKLDDRIAHITNSISESHEAKTVGEINWPRRYQHMRFHTAIHLIDAIVNRNPEYAGLITGSQIYEDRARVDFSLESLDPELANSIIKETNEVIEEKHKVISYFIDAEEAKRIENLARTVPGRELLLKMDTIRIVEIEGVDRQADGGTHVANTSEIGEISLVKIENKGRNNKRMVISIPPAGA